VADVTPVEGGIIYDELRMSTKFFVHRVGTGCVSDAIDAPPMSLWCHSGRNCGLLCDVSVNKKMT
jgi:hypothetical protein